MKIKVKNHNKQYSLKQHGEWVDLATSQRIIMQPNSFWLIPLGIAMQLPKHYEAVMVPRSSTFKKWGIIQTNHMGVIDSDYNGNEDMWRMPAYCFSYQVDIPKNTRLAQFRIQPSFNAPWYVKMLHIFRKYKFVEVDDLGNKNRGGFGTTGN